LTSLLYVNSQNTIISFESIHFYPKIYPIFVTPPLKTHITIASNNPSGNSGFASNNPAGNFPRRDVNDFRDQSQLEADYFDERKIRESQEFEKYSEIYQPEDFDFEDFLEDEIELQIPNVSPTMLTPNFAPDPTDRQDFFHIFA
jgi:hypothetical protein